jgi:predicted SnoaL-like aldol condensation-catalyzing enzyme
MATSQMVKVLTVFRGLSSRDPDLAAKYVHPEKYIEHNPQAGDGVAGLKACIRSFPTDNHLRVVRAFEDGAYVFSQEEGLILGENIFFDIFRFADDLIVEHWVFSAKGAPPNQSGHTQTDGPTGANLSAAEQPQPARAKPGATRMGHPRVLTC